MYSPIADLVGTLVGAQAGGSAFNAATAPARGISSIRDRYGKDKAMMDPTTGTSLSHLAVREAARVQQGRAVDPRLARENLERAQQYFKEAELPVPAAHLLSTDEGMGTLGPRAREQRPVQVLLHDREGNPAADERVRPL